MRYKGLNLNLLHTLDVLMEVQNVSRAADRLGLTQSAVSAALAQLREYFGDPLLMPVGRSMCPTGFAEQLRQQLREFLSATDALLLTSHGFDPASTVRAFRIIASDYVVAAVLAPLAERLSETAPAIRLDFIAPGPEAAETLRRGELDLIISPREFLLPDHPSEELYVETFVVVGWTGNELVSSPIDEGTFLNAGHVAVMIGTHREPAFADKHLLALGHHRRIEAVASSFIMVPWMLRGTRRIALMHERLALAMSLYLPLSYVPMPIPFPAMREMVQFHHARATDPGIRWLIDEIRSAAADSRAELGGRPLPDSIRRSPSKRLSAQRRSEPK